MIPTHALRIQTMLRSLKETIIPAIDRDNQLANDQAQILVQNLMLMADQAGHTFDYEMTEAREYAALLGRLTEAPQGGPAVSAATEAATATLDAIRPVIGMAIPTEGGLAASVRALKGAADAVVLAADQDGDEAYRRRVDQAVLDQSRSQSLRERAWFMAAGMDPAPDEVPSIAVLVSHEAPAT